MPRLTGFGCAETFSWGELVSGRLPEAVETWESLVVRWHGTGEEGRRYTRFPASITGPSEVRSFSIGANHPCGLERLGALFCKGLSTSGGWSTEYSAVIVAAMLHFIFKHLTRLYYYGHDVHVTSQVVINDVRKGVNKYARRRVRRMCSGSFIGHNFNVQEHWYFHRDGVHLSDEGCDLLMENFASAVRFALNLWNFILCMPFVLLRAIRSILKFKE